MPALNWGIISDGGAFESLMHAILYANDPSTILFGRLGKDAGQDARSMDGTVVYQAKYRQGLVMDGAVVLAMEELEKIRAYRQSTHANNVHWRNAQRWVLVANFATNPSDPPKWQGQVVPAFRQEGLLAQYWSIETLEGKLVDHPEVRDVFFAGENRVLVGLKEAHELLAAECVGGDSIEVPMLGRDGELELINAFAASEDKRVLPVVGPGGIGKSRLLYEGLTALANGGWRVFWALPGAMARSSQWFRLLNGAQQTCVAIDDPDDPALLRAVIEQLATVERRNWRVIIATRTEKAEVLCRYRKHSHVHEPIVLPPLDEPTSQQLVKACLAGHAHSPWLHSVYGFTNGVPGWLCLIAELAKRGRLAALPANADEVAHVYVNSCLSALGDARREQGLTLLRWLALWGQLGIDAGDQEQAELRFLKTQGIPVQVTRDALKQLVAAGIVRNWGVGKRLFAVEPLIIRQQILGSWLLREEQGRYEVGPDGSALVAQLVRGEVPAADSALQTLASLARMRLSDSENTVFLGPVFRSMEGSAREGTLLDQYRMVDLVERIGAADPESALDLLRAIRTVAKDSMTVDVPIWGSQTYTHDALVAKLPWVLFELAQRVSAPNTGRRYLGEFGQYVTLEDQGRIEAVSGQKPGELLKRLLCGSGNSDIYAAPAHELVRSELCNPARWPFVGLLAECLLDPVRETTDWVARWTLSFGRRRIATGSSEWKALVTVRGLVFEALRAATQPALCPGLWRMLSVSHHALHREVLQAAVKGAEAEAYHDVLVNDLTRCRDILRGREHASTVDEATAARQMWEWHLKHGKEEALVVLARECEQLYNGRSEWRVHDFFRFETEEALAPETQRIFEAFRNATGPETLNEFFSEAKDYLAAARGKSKDMADDWRIADLARACAGLLDFNSPPPGNAVTAYVRSVLAQQTLHRDNELAWGFTVMLCRKYLLTVKQQGIGMVGEGLGLLLEKTSAKDRLLWGIYGNVHPNTTGVLTDAELNILLAREGDFSNYEWFVLLGAFQTVDRAGIRERLHAQLGAMRENPVEASECLARFIRSVHLAALRYEWPPDQLPVDWIIDQISELGLDGALLTLHDTEWLRDQSGFRVDASAFLRLVESRIEMDTNSSGDVKMERFPHRFSVRDWARFDANDANDVLAFQALCVLALGPSFVGLHWIPKFLAALNPTGSQVAAFIESHLAAHPELDAAATSRLAYLAAAYPDDTDAWRSCAVPIVMRCQKMNLNREDRLHVFFGLSWKESVAYSSMPGQVADIWTQKLNRARTLRDTEPSTSPLRQYRDWVVLCAEHDLRREEGMAEENANG